MPNADARDLARVELFRLGTQYYVSGRFAMLAGLLPVAANLLHHAVEMFLKGALVRDLGLGQLRCFSHDLNRVWGEFKSRVKMANAQDFDVAVGQLHRFERLRYPDTVLKEGMDAAFTLFRNQRFEVYRADGPIDHYSLVLEDIDALVESVFLSSGVNPQFHLQILRDDAKEVLARHNRHPLK